MDDIVKTISINPRLICNSVSKKTKVIDEVETNLENCDSFDLSIAFISDSGIASIKQALLNVINKGTKGRIVTSTYLGFNTPKTFRRLLKLFEGTNIEIKIYQKNGFHPKGYIFNKNNNYKVLIGSSNLTQDALSVNQEWNICLEGNLDDEIIKRVNSEFEEQWEESISLSDEWIDSYEKDYKEPIRYYVSSNNGKGFEPNKMQIEALEALNNIRSEGKKKSLLISATGTGKTFLSAFDVKQLNPKRMLFVVHRETIARKSLESYKKVIKNKTMGMFTGSEKRDDCDYLFCTINTIGKKEYLEKFKKDEFEYIVIDEVHRAGAEMYQELLNYFEPKFLLGMSATPERTDKPEKIYELFDYNVAYEIRLKQAMEFNLLCPFHYYGISDIEIDGDVIDDKASFNKLVNSERIKHILNAIDKYGYSGDKPHGLIFVSRAEEADYLSKAFNEQTSYKTISLTSKNSDDSDRRKAIELLEEKDINKDYLDYIFTVDLFNEGVDIPCINQVIMLRKTESSIVFIQQLGRGLRKNNDKEFVNVIDIIGNYDNNYMIPIALSGSQKYDKDELRRFVHEGNLNLPGSSTISFDEITKTRIYQSIDTARLGTIKLIKEEYQKLKARIGNKIPTLSDFDKYSSIDPLIIFKAKRSYHDFLSEYEDEYKVGLNDTETNFIRCISNKYASGKRVHELLMIKELMNQEKNVFKELKNVLLKDYGINYDSKITNTLINELTGKFNVGSGEKYENVVFMERDEDDYRISNLFKELLQNENFSSMVKELLEFGIDRYIKNYSNRYLDTDLVLYQKYTYEDIYRLLNWEKAEVSLNVGGYKYDSYSNTFPVFINYDKSEAADSIKYGDEFIDSEYLNAISKHPRSLDSNDAKIIENAKQNNTDIHMFVRKNKADDIKEFYYLGIVENCGKLEQIKMPNGEDVFKIPYKFETKVREDIFNYITD